MNIFEQEFIDQFGKHPDDMFIENAKSMDLSEYFDSDLFKKHLKIFGETLINRIEHLMKYAAELEEFKVAQDLKENLTKIKKEWISEED